MNRPLFSIIASVFAIGALINLLMQDPRQQAVESEQPVMVFCAASNRAVMEAVVADYEAETGRQVELQFGPSQSLLSSIEVSGTGDLYLPADDSYLVMAAEKNLIAEVLDIAAQQGGVAVRKGNPKKIHRFSDLLREDVRLVQASPDAAAIASLTRETLQAQQLWDSLDKATDAYRTTVHDVANDVLVDSADAAIVYDAVLYTYPDLEFVEIPELQTVLSKIAVGVIASSSQPQRALHFARYLSAVDRGLKRYEEFSFRVSEGDVWADVPELSFFAGSMLRPAVEETVAAFEQREGVRVSTVYNGCGILVGQMKAGQHPDAYFACDSEFMEQVPDLFPVSYDVAQNELIILVQKDNPHGIQTLEDLTKPGLKVGIGHEKQCAMGWLTQKTLEESSLKERLKPNITVQTPAGDMLVNQMRTGSLDAAIVYLSNAARVRDQLQVILIQGLESSIATQPFAIAEKSRYRQLTGRLFAKLSSAESQDAFVAEGFQWRLK